MNEELEVLKTVARRLEGLGIPYMVTGSRALNYYAVPRMTRDIDVVVELSAADADRLSGAFHDEFYVDPEAARRAVKERGLRPRVRRGGARADPGRTRGLPIAMEPRRVPIDRGDLELALTMHSLET